MIAQLVWEHICIHGDPALLFSESVQAYLCLRAHVVDRLEVGGWLANYCAGEVL